MTPEQGRTVAKKMNATYMECSSKEMDGVDDIFDSAVTMAVGDEWKPANNRNSTGADQPSFGSRKPKKSKCRIL